MFAEAARADTGIDPKMPIAMDKLEWLQSSVKRGTCRSVRRERVITATFRAQARRARAPQ